jgi:hypothetical protein
MCECGCVYNDRRYKFPAPNRAFYVLTLHSACTNCYTPSGVAIELVEPGTALYKEVKSPDFTEGVLRFEKWPDSKGVGVVCGFTREEFVKACASHLIGVNSIELGDGSGELDDVAAEEILVEMYTDASPQPRLTSDRGVTPRG